MHAELFASDERRNPSIRPLQSFLLLDGHLQKETMAAFAHDVVELHDAPPAPPPFAAGLVDALSGAPGARRLRVGYVSSVSDSCYYQKLSDSELSLGLDTGCSVVDLRRRP